MKGKLLILSIVFVTLIVTALLWLYIKDFIEKHDIDENANGYYIMHIKEDVQRT
ncbi:hypothetical protein GMD78_11040 [Ornithinibacillus sp. L9]|uniref:Uncharacterized protein n=1 Tax=Ornithinibacillus caprae TaxID=2678566 RepID=A0A6N8FMG3_9BACI|nr:hypothetical protein [Ornithinibacillus caprae]MUK88929.1 hypothetical protein [Ornithinibacillus caprae]